jgi:hypothetical protein
MAQDTHHAKALPADLGAPAFVDVWKTRAAIIAVVFLLIAVGLASSASRRTGLAGTTFCAAGCWALVLTFGWAVGGLALLMVQYVTGGKWGLLLRRPLEAMSRTLPVVFVYWLVIWIFYEEALPVGAGGRIEPVRCGTGHEGRLHQ